MDPQLRAIRLAARERFLAQRAAAPGSAGPRPEEQGDSAGRSAGISEAELLDAPIASLLADGPAWPPAKRRRSEGPQGPVGPHGPQEVQDPSALRVPPDQTAEIRRLLALPAPTAVRVLSWNIDGLDEVGGPRGLMLRTLAVALEVARQRPVAVLLQEAVPPALELLAAEQVLGGSYKTLVPKDPPMPYYAAMLVDRRRAEQLGEPETVDFPGTQMGRQLLAVALKLPGAPPLLLATAHLESTKDQAPERKRQLAQSFRFLRAAVGRVPKGAPVGTERVGAALLAGDLNLRDEEVKVVLRDLGDEGKGIADAWSFCGSPDDARWTWDTVANNNVGASYSCRTRFDRLFFLSPGISDGRGASGRSQAAAKGKAAASRAVGSGSNGLEVAGWRPVGFSLVGKDRVPSLGRFPSDHWGILASWSAGAVPAEPPPPAKGNDKLMSLKPGKFLIDLDD